MSQRTEAPELERTAGELVTEVEQLHRALLTRTIIGQATGLLAARHRLRSDQGWILLRELSNRTNLRLADVAATIVHLHDGHLDGQPDRRAALALATVLDDAVERVRRGRPMAS